MANPTTIGQATAKHQARSNNSRTEVQTSICDKNVLPAAESIVGRCEYYYRPLHDEYVEKTGVATWEVVKAWAGTWNPWRDYDIAKRLLTKRDKLIQANTSDGDWSRHANFMVRHIGCDHTPPNYYVSYGYYYCSTYGVKLAPRLSDQGKDWLKLARQKLQENMEKGLKDNMDGNQISVVCKTAPDRSVSMEWPQLELEVSSAKFKEFAFSTHVPAYLDAGLADLPISDLLEIGGQPNIEEWLDKDTWNQAIESGKEVAKHKVSQAVNDVLDFLMKPFR